MANRRGSDDRGATSERILAAAAEFFAAKGFHATTTREIAAAIGVRSPSLYHHFPGKEDMLYHIASRTMDDLLVGGRSAVCSSPNPESQLRRLIEWHVRYSCEHRVQARVADEQLHALSDSRRQSVVTVRDDYEQLFRAVLTAGREERGWQVDDVAVTTFALATMASGVVTWFRPQGRLRVDEVASIYGDLAVRAVAPAPLARAATVKPARRGPAGRS